MATEGLWHQMTSTDWDEFAQTWLAELRMSSPTCDSDPDRSATASDVGEAVVLMNFTAEPDQQWQFICSAVAQAQSDDELRHIAARPIEHALGWHGDTVIARVEDRAAVDAKFSRMLTGVSKYLMSDEVWERVQAIQARVSEPV